MNKDLDKNVLKKLEDIMNSLENDIYSASGGFEKAEYIKDSNGINVLHGNGHHIRQHISQAVAVYFKERLSEPYKSYFEEKYKYSKFAYQQLELK